jgi:tetratricopeptide (TPR) repeat protein
LYFYLTFTATLWPAREIRAEILSKRGDDEDIAKALANLISNRIEALELGAWWQAWRALVRECDLNCDLGQPEIGIKAAKQFEDASPKNGPKLMGKMQRAVMMYYDGVHKDDSTEIRDAIGLLEEVYPSLGELENIIPKHEIEGIEIWLTSIQAWCLDYLGEHGDAIKVARQVLDLTCRIKSDREISRALGQLTRCLEKAGNLSEAFENTRSRFNLCKRKGGEFAEEAAEAARSAGRILNQINKSSPTTETDSLSEHWYSQAIEIYKKLGKIVLVEEIEKEMSSL